MNRKSLTVEWTLTSPVHYGETIGFRILLLLKSLIYYTSQKEVTFFYAWCSVLVDYHINPLLIRCFKMSK